MMCPHCKQVFKLTLDKERIQKIIDMRKEGISVRIIAKTVNCSNSTVLDTIKKIQNLISTGIVKHPYSEE